MRINKERAKLVVTRPDWLTNDTHWSIFKDYRDSKQSADDLAVLYQMSRAQVQNIVRNIVDRFSRPGELSVRTVKVLRSLGLTLAPDKLRQELQELKSKAALSTGGDLNTYLLSVENCGRKTRMEILSLYEEMASDRALDPAA